MTAARKGRIYNHAKKVSHLNDMGFVWNPAEKSKKLLVECMRHYKALHGDLDVPRNYIVPPQPPFPPEAWGMKLGLKVRAIKHSVRVVKIG